MSERDGYEPGVPCWVATVHPDPEKAVGFYTELFGWETTNLMSPESSSKYYACKRRGRDVAAIGSERDGAPSGSAWNTYIWADSADDTVAKVVDAGGRVVIEPFDRHRVPPSSTLPSQTFATSSSTSEPTATW